MTDRLTSSTALQQLQANPGVPFARVFRHGSLQVEIYKPDGVDHQTPHTRDEVYVVISGSGQFLNGVTRQPFEAGEVLFVPAGVVHRFEVHPWRQRASSKRPHYLGRVERCH